MSYCDCRSTIRMDCELMELCKSVGRKRDVEIVGMRVLDGCGIMFGQV